MPVVCVLQVLQRIADMRTTSNEIEERERDGAQGKLAAQFSYLNEVAWR